LHTHKDIGIHIMKTQIKLSAIAAAIISVLIVTTANGAEDIKDANTYAPIQSVYLTVERENNPQPGANVYKGRAIDNPNFLVKHEIRVLELSSSIPRESLVIAQILNDVNAYQLTFKDSNVMLNASAAFIEKLVADHKAVMFDGLVILTKEAKHQIEGAVISSSIESSQELTASKDGIFSISTPKS